MRSSDNLLAMKQFLKFLYCQKMTMEAQMKLDVVDKNDVRLPLDLHGDDHRQNLHQLLLAVGRLAGHDGTLLGLVVPEVDDNALRDVSLGGLDLEQLRIACQTQTREKSTHIFHAS